MGKIKKQWKSGGVQDKFIKKLIKQGKVNKYTKPSSLQATYPSLLSEFSTNVIRNHLNVLKGSNGLHFDDEKDANSAKKKDIKMGGTFNHPYAHYNATTSSCRKNIIHQNYPVLCETYKDPENQNDKVVMAVSLPGGAQNVKIELHNDGTMAIIKYTWPKTMFDMEDLFKKQLATKQIHIHHPKILCLKNGLENVRKRNGMPPNSLIKVNLPIKVQTGSDFWTKSVLKWEDGTQVVLAEFHGFIKSYNKK